MPDTFTSPTLLEFHIPGTVSVGVQTAMRRSVMFDYDIIGANLSAGTPPTTSALIVDLSAGPATTVNKLLVPIWTASSGSTVQTVTFTATSGQTLGGTCTLAISGSTVTVTPGTTTAATLQTALNTLLGTTLGLAATCTVTGAVTTAGTGTAFGAFVVTFSPASPYGQLMIANGGSLTGTGAAVAVTAQTTDKRPQIAAGAVDQAPIASSTYTVAPIGTDPPLSGQSAGVSTTYNTYNDFPFLASPDSNAAGFGFAGRQPIQEGNPLTVLGTPGVPQAGQPPVYSGHAGDALLPYIVQVGSGTAGADLTLSVWLNKR